MAARTLIPLLAVIVLSWSAGARAWDTVPEECDLAGPPVCGSDGIEYTNECIAQAQGVEVAIFGFCDGSVGEFSEWSEASATQGPEAGEESSEEESSPGLDPGVYIDRALRETTGRVKVSTINRYSSLGYRFVGSFRNRTGLPTERSAVLDDAGTLVSDLPFGTALDRTGQHYVQPRNRERRSAAVRTLPRRPTATFRRSLLGQIGIIGTDDRTQAPVNTFPSTAVVSMRFEVEGTKAGCSATFIAGNVLLTSAHCLYDDVQGYYFSFDSYKFYKANGDMLDAEVQLAVVPTQFIQGFPQMDIGMVLLDRSFEEELGYLGRGYACDVPKAECALLGYPVDKGGDKLYQSTCTVVPECDRVVLEHQCDDAPGMSGGPLFSRTDDVVKAVLLGALDADTNTAVLLTKEIIAYINEVVDSLDKLARSG